MAREACACMQGMKPVLMMVLVQILFAGVNIFYKLAVNDGMSSKVLAAYRYIFASAFLAPLAFFLEREKRPPLTWKVLLQASACGLFGGTLAQNLYIGAMNLCSATFVSAITNLIPAIIFVMAVICGMERFRIRSPSGQAKAAGTLVGIGGAMLLTFYKGAEIRLWSSHFNLAGSRRAQPADTAESGNRVSGSLLAVASCFSYAIWLIIQTKMSEIYPCHYSSTVLMCFTASVFGVVYAFATGVHVSEWKLGCDIRLFTVIYAGVLASGVCITLVSWCIKRKGPLFVSVFNPLMLVVVAIVGSLVLNEKLHLGSVLGSILIIIGLYVVLWGKGRELEQSVHLPTRAGDSRRDSSVSAEAIEVTIWDSSSDLSANPVVKGEEMMADDSAKDELKGRETMADDSAKDELKG